MPGHHYSHEEKFDMLTCYILCHKNIVNTAAMYLNTYPERSQPCKTIFLELARNLKEYGSFKKPVLSRKKESSDETQNKVLQAVVENPEISTRQIEYNVGVAKSTAQFILRKNRYHPYTFRICQGLKLGDFERRRHFSEWYTRACEENLNFPSKIIWSDESMVTNNGIFNRRNTHYWAQKNPRVKKISRHQERFGFNMWCGILGTKILGPFIYHNSLTAERYLHLLQNDLEYCLDNLPLAQVNSCWFQQDGAPAHNSRQVREYLSQRFPGKWIGTFSEVSWPARSPDLTPLDFFIWGFVKNRIYQYSFESEQQLRERVTAAFNSITPEMLRDVLSSTVKRSYLCLENNGNLFEHLL